MSYNKSIMKSFKPSSIISYGLLGILSLTCIYPLIWLLLNSFKSSGEMFENPWSIGSKFEYMNYITAWFSGNIGVSFLNSTLVSLVSVVITIIVGSMAAFAIARLRWKLSGFVLVLFLLGVMIPIHATVIPLFIIFNTVKLTNNYLALILPYVAFALPTSIFILTGFMRTFPSEIEESAVIDGSTMFGVFFHIIMPLTKSAVATITIFNFVAMWNELMFSLIFMSDANRMTLPVCITRFRGQYSTDWSVLLAATVIMVVPSLLVYMFLNDKIIQSLTVGAVKG